MEVGKFYDPYMNIFGYGSGLYRDKFGADEKYELNSDCLAEAFSECLNDY